MFVPFSLTDCPSRHPHRMLVPGDELAKQLRVESSTLKLTAEPSQRGSIS